MNPTPSPEAVEAAKEIGHDLARDSEISAGVSAQYAYDPLQATHIVDRACRTYAARQNAELFRIINIPICGLHAPDDRGPCLCNQCDFVRARAALKQTELP